MKRAARGLKPAAKRASRTSRSAAMEDEKMWSKIKAFLRKVKARTEEALFTAIGDALKTVTAADAAGWFASCGYIQP